MDTKKVGIYIRVSSTEQAEEGYSIGAQEEKLKAYCSARGWSIHEVYTDPGFTGANIKRPAMQKMIRDIKKHELDIVLVYKLDRFTRSQKDCVNLLEDTLLPNNCDFVSLNENFDTSTPYGRAMIGILSVFAQLERETIRERTVMGRIERAKAGWYSGADRIPIGYDYVDGKLVINEYEAMQIREMYDMYINGASALKIWKTFEEKHYTTKHGSWSSNSVIRRLLDSHLYFGEIKYKGKYYQGNHEPIITKELWEAAQVRKKLLQENEKGGRKSPFTSMHLLTGLLYCGNCGARMHAKKRSSKMESEYMCYSFSKTSSKYITDPNCRAKIWRVSELDNLVIEKIMELSYSEIKKMQNDHPVESNIQTLKKRIADIDKNIDKLMELYMIDSMPKSTIEKKSRALAEERELLKSQIESIENEKQRMKPRQVMGIINEIKFVMNEGEISDKKSILAQLIDHIDVFDSGVTIHWTFLK